MIYRRAVDAVIWGLPLVGEELVRQAYIRDGKAKYNDIVWRTKGGGWKNQLPTANVNTRYMYFFINTEQDRPAVVDLPPAIPGANFYGTIEGAWYVPLADIGFEGKGGKYLVLPPDYKGDVPAGYSVVRPGSRSSSPSWSTTWPACAACGRTSSAWRRLQRRLRDPWSGESQIETDRRLARDRIAALQRRLEQVKGTRAIQRAERERAHLPQMALAGYTNAGKSTLLNAMTGSRRRRPRPAVPHAGPDDASRCGSTAARTCMTDTVGFIRKLPHQLVDAFGATLEETRLADLHPARGRRPAEEDERRRCCGRSRTRSRRSAPATGRDCWSSTRSTRSTPSAPGLRHRHPDGRAGQRLTGEGLDDLRRGDRGGLRPHAGVVELLLPYSEGGRLAELHDVAGDLHREDTAEGVRVVARLPTRSRSATSASRSTASSRLDQAAVDDVVRAGHVAGALGGQQRDERGDLLGRREAAGGEPADSGDDAARAVSASTPVAAPTVSATPCSPSQRSVPTGPGEMQFTRMPFAPNSCASDLLRLTSAALAAP